MNLNDYLNEIYFNGFRPKEYAGFFIRFLAFLIDITILSIFNYFIIVTFDLSITVHSKVFDPLWLISHPYSLLINWLYFAILESNKYYQATIGKSILKLKVVDSYNNKISFGKASLRFFAKFISAITLGIGFIMIGITKNKQGLHDLAVGSFVKYNTN